MLKVLERDYKQTMDSALEEFPNSVITMSIEKPEDECGFLLAVSIDSQSHKDLALYLRTIPKSTILYTAGEYIH